MVEEKPGIRKQVTGSDVEAKVELPPALPLLLPSLQLAPQILKALHQPPLLHKLHPVQHQLLGQVHL